MIYNYYHIQQLTLFIRKVKNKRKGKKGEKEKEKKLEIILFS